MSWTGLFLFAATANAHDLTIERGDKSVSFTAASLLSRSQPVDLARDPTYNVRKIFQGVDVKTLFQGDLPPETSTLLFEALDGFRVSVSAKKLFYTPGARAILAIEDPKHPWAKIKKKNASAGPFYLIWIGDDAVVGQEEWPFMVTKILVQRALAEEYPGLVPKVKLGSAVYRGYQAFAKNCFACHALNGVGGEKMGPDLNVPHSPTEYLRKSFFVKLIRNPQSLRQWSGSQMSAFSKTSMSDEEVDDVWDYLKHMQR